jgi:hypothetical protein
MGHLIMAFLDSGLQTSEIVLPPVQGGNAGNLPPFLSSAQKRQPHRDHEHSDRRRQR